MLSLAFIPLPFAIPFPWDIPEIMVDVTVRALGMDKLKENSTFVAAWLTQLPDWSMNWKVLPDGTKVGTPTKVAGRTDQTIAIAMGLTGLMAIVGTVRYWAAGLVSGDGYAAVMALGRAVAAFVGLMLYKDLFSKGVEFSNLVSKTIALGSGESMANLIRTTASFGEQGALLPIMIGGTLIYVLIFIKLIVAQLLAFVFVMTPLAIGMSPLYQRPLQLCLGFGYCCCASCVTLACCLTVVGHLFPTIGFDANGEALAIPSIGGLIACASLFLMVKVQTTVFRQAALAQASPNIARGMMTAAYIGMRFRVLAGGKGAAKMPKPTQFTAPRTGPSVNYAAATGPVTTWDGKKFGVSGNYASREHDPVYMGTREDGSHRYVQPNIGLIGHISPQPESHTLKDESADQFGPTPQQDMQANREQFALPQEASAGPPDEHGRVPTQPRPPERSALPPAPNAVSYGADPNGSSHTIGLQPGHPMAHKSPNHGPTTLTFHSPSADAKAHGISAVFQSRAEHTGAGGGGLDHSQFYHRFESGRIEPAVPLSDLPAPASPPDPSLASLFNAPAGGAAGGGAPPPPSSDMIEPTTIFGPVTPEPPPPEPPRRPNDIALGSSNYEWLD